MKTKIFFTAVLFVSTAIANAQSNRYILIKPEIAIPIADFQSAYKTGYGAHAQFVIGGTPRTNLTGSIGYLKFNRKPPLYKGSGTLIPIRIGLQTYMSRNLFLSGEAGTALSSGQIGKDPYYGFTAGPGLSFEAGKGIVALIGAYNVYFLHGTNIQWIGVNAAYGFRL